MFTLTDFTIDRGNCYLTDGSIVTVTNTNDTIRVTGSQIVVQIIPTTKIDYIYDNKLVVGII